MPLIQQPFPQANSATVILRSDKWRNIDERHSQPVKCSARTTSCCAQPASMLHACCAIATTLQPAPRQQFGNGAIPPHVAMHSCYTTGPLGAVLAQPQHSSRQHSAQCAAGTLLNSMVCPPSGSRQSPSYTPAIPHITKVADNFYWHLAGLTELPALSSTVSSALWLSSFKPASCSCTEASIGWGSLAGLLC